jgi:transcriptional regulator with XRE-family HTH domain
MRAPLDTIQLMAPGELDSLMAGLRAWLKQHHGEQKKLAEELGVSPAILSHWLARRKDPGLKNYLSLRAFLAKAKRRKP